MNIPLSELLDFQVDAESLAAFEEMVKSSGLSQQELFRELVLNDKTQVNERKVIPDNTRQALYLLNKASNDMIKLAKEAGIANQAGDLSDDLYTSLLDELENQQQLLRALLDRVN